MKAILDSKPFFLLCSLIVFMLASPFIEATQWGDLLITAILTGILLSLVRYVSDHLKLQIGIGILAGCTLVLLWAGEAFPPNDVWLWGLALDICLNVFVIFFALTKIVTAKNVDRDVLIGAIAVYLLLGITWALAYNFVHAIEPSSFGDVLVSQQSNWNQFVYFSFSTLTTLGYGDIVAVGPFARTLSVFEAISGVVFEVIIIARLVGLYRGAQDTPENNTVQ